MNRSINSIAIGLILIFVIQVISLVGRLSNITFIVDDNIVSTPPINISLYIIPAIFILYGIITMFLKSIKKLINDNYTHILKKSNNKNVQSTNL